MQRATFTSVDPTLRILLSAAGISFVPHHRFGASGGYVLHIIDDTPFGTCVGTYTAPFLWKLITERKPGQSIQEVLLAALHVDDTEAA